MKLFSLIYCLEFKCLYYVVKFFYDESLKNTKLSTGIEPGKKVAIYGFGPYGEQTFIKYYYVYKIVSIFDIKYKTLPNCIKSPEKIVKFDFDYIIVTVMDEIIRREVINFLLSKGIPEEKIVHLIYYKK